VTKEEVRSMVGVNIRNERHNHSLSIEELSELLDITPGFLGLIERGERGATPHNLLKLANVFDSPIDRFFYHDQREAISKSAILRKKLTALTTNFTENELDFTIVVIKAMNRLQTP